MYFYALYSFSSLLVAVVSSHFSFSCVRGPVCTFFVFFFFLFLLVFFLLLLLLLFLLLQCQHHERRPTDRQSTTTCFTQLKESNGSSGNSSKTRNNNASNNFSFNLQYNIVSLHFVFCVRACVFSFRLFVLFRFIIIQLDPSIAIIRNNPQNTKKKPNLFLLFNYIYIYISMMNIETLLQAAQILESQQSIPPKKRLARGEYDS